MHLHTKFGIPTSKNIRDISVGRCVILCACFGKNVKQWHTFSSRKMHPVLETIGFKFFLDVLMSQSGIPIFSLFKVYFLHSFVVSNCKVVTFHFVSWVRCGA